MSETQKQKRKLSEENDGELIEIYASIGDVRVEMEDFKEETESELINLRKAMDKMNKRIEEICSLLKFPATTQVGRKARSVLSGAGGW